MHALVLQGGTMFGTLSSSLVVSAQYRACIEHFLHLRPTSHKMSNASVRSACDFRLRADGCVRHSISSFLRCNKSSSVSYFMQCNKSSSVSSFMRRNDSSQHACCTIQARGRVCACQTDFLQTYPESCNTSKPTHVGRHLGSASRSVQPGPTTHPCMAQEGCPIALLVIKGWPHRTHRITCTRRKTSHALLTWSRDLDTQARDLGVPVRDLDIPARDLGMPARKTEDDG